MQGMLDNLSQPVAFATVPLGDAGPYSSRSQSPPSTRRDVGCGSDTDTDDPVLTRLTRRIGISHGGRKITRGSIADSSSRRGDEDFGEGVFDEGQLYVCLIVEQLSKLTFRLLRRRAF